MELESYLLFGIVPEELTDQVLKAVAGGAKVKLVFCFAIKQFHENLMDVEQGIQYNYTLMVHS